MGKSSCLRRVTTSGLAGLFRVATHNKIKLIRTNINLLEIVNKTLDDQVALKDLDAESRKEAETKIWAIYEDPKYKKLKRYLHTNYPILGIVPEEYK